MSAPNVRKYVIVTDHIKPRAIVFDRELQHSEVVPKGLKPISAGFLAITGPGQFAIMPTIGSDSLGLLPHPEDRNFLNEFFAPSN